jgi:DegV family protein with EDD domain
MPGVRFVCDSTADLDPGYREAHGVRTVPLKVLFGDETFVDGVDIDAATFYSKMRGSSRNPTTSQPTPAEFEAAFRAAAADGSTVVCTTISSEMSGTYGAAVAAREALADLDIRVIDTRTVAMGHHLVVRQAVACADDGGSADAVMETISEVMRRERSLFTVPTLEYLRRGGRIGGAKALLGSMLSIKPVLQLADGRIEPYDKARTNQRALERIGDELISAVGESGRKAVAVAGHAERLDDCLAMAERVRPHCVSDPIVMAIGPIVGSHAGPGCIGLTFILAPGE